MEKKDYLDRNGYIKTLCTIVENFSKSNLNVSFAIDGDWGSGKSFLLDKFEKETRDKYIIFHYNCWQYDYYEEPLIAIVSMMINQIENDEMILGDVQKKTFLDGLKIVGIIATKCLGKVVENKTGISHDTFDSVLKEIKELNIDCENDIKEYDHFWTFKKTLELLQKSIRKITEEKTVVFVVDELDRCLPDYSIKVLERLHHISEGLRNFVTIISIDKKRLLNSIANAFGYDKEINNYSDSERYLKKFINFYIWLNKGNISDDISEKYQKYLDFFDEKLFDCKITFANYVRDLFNKIDIREQEQLFEKVYMVHSMAADLTQKYDYTVMYMELLLVVTFSFYGMGANQLFSKRRDLDDRLMTFFQQFKSLNYSYTYGSSVNDRILKVNSFNGCLQILEWYATFMGLDRKIPVNGISPITNMITEIDLESNIKFLEKFYDFLICF